MRQNFIKHLLLLSIIFFLSSCGKMKPEEYFNIAVLNTNLIQGFSGTGFSRELQSPSVKMPENGGEPVPMKRTEVLNSKLSVIEDNYDKVKSLKVTDETKDMIDASLKLYEFVLPVYKTEYSQLAELYDNNAPEDQIQKLETSIFDNYNKGYTELYMKVISTGKAYAEKNSIKVNWGDN